MTETLVGLVGVIVGSVTRGSVILDTGFWNGALGGLILGTGRRGSDRSRCWRPFRAYYSGLEARKVG